MFHTLLTTVSAVAVITAVSATAGEYGSVGNGGVTIQQAASMMAYDAGNDRARISIAPNWSDELGWSVRASAGSYMGDAVAMGVIVEYGKDKQEYLANLGFQITDAMSLIGTVGNLAETKEFIAGSGKDKASQMEYGLSLRQSMQDGMGFELNGYGVNARASNDAIETGKLYGAEGLLTLGLADSTMIKLGGGYEWLKWETTGEKNNHWSGRAEFNQRLTDNLSLQGEAKLGASERSYGGGLSLNVTDTSLLGFHYTQIQGRNGIADDKRAEVSFTLGFGGNSTNTAATDASTPNQTIKAASLATSASHNSLLLDVMKRPGYLPERVLAREGNSCLTVQPLYEIGYQNNTVPIHAELGDFLGGWVVAIQTSFISGDGDYPVSIVLGEYILPLVSEDSGYLLYGREGSLPAPYSTTLDNFTATYEFTFGCLTLNAVAISPPQPD